MVNYTSDTEKVNKKNEKNLEKVNKPLYGNQLDGRRNISLFTDFLFFLQKIGRLAIEKSSNKGIVPAREIRSIGQWSKAGDGRRFNYKLVSCCKFGGKENWSHVIYNWYKDGDLPGKILSCLVVGDSYHAQKNAQKLKEFLGWFASTLQNPVAEIAKMMLGKSMSSKKEIKKIAEASETEQEKKLSFARMILRNHAKQADYKNVWLVTDKAMVFAIAVGDDPTTLTSSVNKFFSGNLVDPHNIYITINPLKPESAKKITPSIDKKIAQETKKVSYRTTQGTDIACVCAMVLDFDRRNKIKEGDNVLFASDAELEVMRGEIESIVIPRLQQAGINYNAMVMTGNGYQLWIAFDAQNDVPKASQVVSRFLHGFKSELDGHGDLAIDLDSSLGDPNRIVRIPCTRNIKAGYIEKTAGGRVSRLSEGYIASGELNDFAKVCELAESFPAEPVDFVKDETLAKPTKTREGKSPQLSQNAVMARIQKIISEKMTSFSIAGNYLLLDACPVCKGDHYNSKIIVNAEGAVGYACHNPACECHTTRNKGKHWQLLKQSLGILSKKMPEKTTTHKKLEAAFCKAYIDQVAKAKKIFGTENVEYIITNEDHFPLAYISLALDAMQKGYAINIVKIGGQGTGKTYADKTLVKEIDDINYDRETPFSQLTISPQKILTENHAKNFGFESYSDWKGGEIPLKLAICLPSIYRLSCKSKGTLGVISFDESESIARLLKSRLTNVRTSSEKEDGSKFDNVEMLRSLMETGFVAMFTDAHAGAGTKALIDFGRPETAKTIVFINIAQMPEKKAVFHSSLPSMLKRIIKNIQHGERFFLQTNSKSKAKTIHAFFDELVNAESGLTPEEKAECMALLGSISGNNKYLLITSEDTGDVEQSTFLENPAIEAKKYAGVIATPVICTGYSIDKKNLFDAIYGLFINSDNTNLPIDCVQMIGRVRNPSSLEYNFYIKDVATTREERPENILKTALAKETLEDELIGMTKAIAGYHYGYSAKRWIVRDQKYADLYAIVKAEDNRMKNNFVEVFVATLKNEGFASFEYYENWRTEEQTINKIIMGTEERQKEKEIVAIAEVEPITEEKYNVIRENGKPSQLESYQSKQYLAIKKYEKALAKGRTLIDAIRFDATNPQIHNWQKLYIYSELEYFKACGNITVKKNQSVIIKTNNTYNVEMRTPLLFGDCFSRVLGAVGLDIRTLGVTEDAKPYTYKTPAIKEFLQWVLENHSGLMSLFGGNFYTKPKLLLTMTTKPMQIISFFLSKLGLKHGAAGKKKEGVTRSKKYFVDIERLATVKTWLKDMDILKPELTPLCTHTQHAINGVDINKVWERILSLIKESEDKFAHIYRKADAEIMGEVYRLFATTKGGNVSKTKKEKLDTLFSFFSLEVWTAFFAKMRKEQCKISPVMP